MQVGFIGAGTIGEHMANRLHRAGLALEICDIRADVRERYAARGIPATHEARALRDCDCVVVMVATEQQLDEVIFGAGGLAAALDPQAPLLLIVMSTVLPATMHALRERLGATKVRLLDAPVSGGPARAEQGTLAIMVGGSEPDYAAALPVLKAMGNPIFHCGALGTGSLTKLVNNVIGVSNLYLAAEAYALALELGGDLTQMIPVLDAGTGRNFTSTGLADAQSFYGMFLDPPRGFEALLEVTTKDLQLIARLARDADSALPVLDGVATGLAAMHEQAVGAAIFRQWEAIVASGAGATGADGSPVRPLPLNAECPVAGTVTFLFTDIEGSTLLWEQEPDEMRPALARHDALVRAAVVSNAGTVVKMTGDGVYAAFDDPVTALDAAVAIQRGLADPEATAGPELRVRCGLHLGEVERRDDDYFGGAVNRAARIMGAAHGGQILLSHAMVDQVRRRLPSSCSLRDLGTVRLKDLAMPERVYQLVHPQLRSDFPALRSLETTPNNLPQQISSFVGRVQETAEVTRLLARNRLLTLVGIGGIGKTRLMLQAAADALDAFPDGAWFVELASITDASLVPSSIAQVLGVQERSGTALTQTLCTHLKSRRLLLVLDNCEHLVTACATLAASFLEAAPQMRILASSREPLRVAGEQVYVVPPLSLPPPDADLESMARSEAAQLFVERVRLQDAGFVATTRQAAAIASICMHLDGIPLALELAAGRVHSLSIDEINVRLKDRFKLLTGGSRSALPRQQTLRATLDWSYELLTGDERSVFDRCAIFSGGFTLASASFVAADETIDEFAVTDLLSHLVARSLVVAETTGGGSRYRLLETARTYALEKLAATGETERVARRHAGHFCERFARAADDWMSTPDADWRAAYLPERDNVRAALEWALLAGGDRATGIALAGASGPIWTELSLYGEGHRRLEAAAERIDAHTPAGDEARLWLWLGLNWALASPDKAVPALRHAVDLYRRLDDKKSLGFTLARLAHEEAMAGRFDQAAAVLAEALPLVENAGLPKVLGDYFDYSAVLKALTGDPAGARSDLEKALELYRHAGAERYALYTLAQLADVAWALGDLDAAAAGIRETIALLRRAPLTKVMLGICLSNLAGVHTERGELDAALAAAREGLPLLKEGGFAWSHLDHLALRAALAGSFANAVRIAGHSDSAFSARKTPRQPNEARSRDRLQAMLREKYAASELERLLAEGAKLSEDAACKLALDDAP